jgi:hypothetical protein
VLVAHRSRLFVEDSHEPQLKVKDENVGWKHTCSGCFHAGFERIGSRSGYNPVEDIYMLQRPSSCDPHFRYSEIPAGLTCPETLKQTPKKIGHAHCFSEMWQVCVLIGARISAKWRESLWGGR